MNARALRDFADKDTGAIRKAGDVFEVTEGRFAEINSTRYGTLVEEVKSKRRRTKTTEE